MTDPVSAELAWLHELRMEIGAVEHHLSCVPGYYERGAYEQMNACKMLAAHERKRLDVVLAKRPVAST